MAKGGNGMIKMVSDKIKEYETILADPSETDRSYYEGKIEALEWMLEELISEA
jgi:hypothetical protein